MLKLTFFLVAIACFSLTGFGQSEVKLIKQNGDYYFENGNYTEALNQYEKAIRTCDNCSRSFQINLFVGKGRALQLLEKYDLAFLSLNKALNLSSIDIAEVSDARLNALVSLAEYHRNRRDYFEARSFLKLCEPIVEMEGVTDEHKANYYNRFAAVINENHPSPDSVIFLSENALKYARKIHSNNLIAISLNEISHVEEHYGDREKAIVGYRESADLWIEVNNKRAAASALYNLSRVYQKKQDYKKCIEVADEAIDLVYAKDRVSILVNLYSIKTQALFALGNYKYGSDVQALYYEAVLRLWEKEKNKGMVEIASKLELGRKNEALFKTIKNNRMVQLQLKTERIRFQIAQQNKYNLIYILIIGSCLLLLSTFLTFRALRVNRRLKWLVESRQLLLKEVHHRVKNNMQTVSSLLDLQTLFVKDKVAINAIQIGKDRINSLALAHQNLYVNNKYDSIDLKQYIQSIANSVIPKDVVFELYMEDLDFEIEKAQSVGFIINELMMNSIKHAWSVDATEKNISLTFRKCEKEKGKSWCMEYQDTGNGVIDKKKFKESPTFGVTIINTFLKRNLKGSYHFGDSSGMHLCFEFN